MLRNFVAFAALALGAVLVLPDSSLAGGGGIRGGFRGGLRAPFIGHRHVRGGILRTAPFRSGAPLAAPHHLPAALHLPARNLARTTVRAPFARLERRHHQAYIYGSTYPVTTDNDAAYIGTPYDPGEAIPVYAPPSLAGLADPPAPPAAPKLSGTRDENQDACRSERVTVPAAEGEREITVVRC